MTQFIQQSKSKAFTLIELLVVISIIGVLAGLTVGLTGIATRKSKEARIQTEKTKLINAIENYKSAVGSYPPDHPGFPGRNQLFYELSGTIFTNNGFMTPNGQGLIPASSLQSLFGVSGFANSARVESDLKFKEEFKASQVQRISQNPAIDVLAVPVKGPAWWAIPVGSVTVNPWLYVSTNPTNNADRYDLWTEAVVGGKVVRFSNWERDPVVVQ